LHALKLQMYFLVREHVVFVFFRERSHTFEQQPQMTKINCGFVFQWVPLAVTTIPRDLRFHY
jgi:hypothetical protein